jgi:hypothetical protein
MSCGLLFCFYLLLLPPSTRTLLSWDFDSQCVSQTVSQKKIPYISEFWLDLCSFHTGKPRKMLTLGGQSLRISWWLCICQVGLMHLIFKEYTYTEGFVCVWTCLIVRLCVFVYFYQRPIFLFSLFDLKRIIQSFQLSACWCFFLPESFILSSVFV